VNEAQLPQAQPAPVPTVRPVPPTVYPEARPAPPSPARDLPTVVRAPRPFPARVGDFFLASGGWLWRWLVGAAMCFNVFLLSWFTAIVAVGWTNRVVEMVVLRCWYWRSEVRRRLTFAEFCATLDLDAPVPRPRWFYRERMMRHAAQLLPGGRQPGPFTTLARIATWPWYGLWQNFLIGAKATFCTYTLLGLPCVLMLWSWEQGWINSFHGGYEQAWFGPTMGFLGIFLFIAAMYYVPMAQAHQAATGQARAYFDFRFVWLLVRARPTAYVLLAVAISFWSLVLHALRFSVVGAGFPGNVPATAQEGLAAFRVYLIWLSLFMFPVFVLLRVLAGVVYQSAVLKVLRRGQVTQAELHPVLRGWLERLGLRIIPVAETVGLTWYARLSARWAYRRVLFTVLFFLWFAFMVRFYVGYFFVYDPYTGILNGHPLIQIPCFDYIPYHLYQGREH
jgi:hypothetical protein